jgi:hypothetical protein
VISIFRARRSAVIACLTLACLLGTSVAPVHGAWNGRFSIWRNGAFATQYTNFSCVGATIQIMLNLVHGRSDRSRQNQFEYLDYAQANSAFEVTDLGADPEGWAVAMRRYGAGDDYGWVTHASMEDSLRTAASQMRETGKPVGLLVHLGRHAWVMTGFEATADPLITDDFTVTSAEVLGPLWPHGTLNGRPFDPAPGTWLDLQALGRKFDTYAEPQQPLWSGRWVTIVPRASEVVVSEPGTNPNGQLPDVTSAFGWMWVFNEIAAKIAVRDLLWLP